MKEQGNYLKRSNQIRLSKNLFSPVTKLLASFHSHSIQAIVLVMKELSNYLKHSNPIHLSLFSGSGVSNLGYISFSLNTGNYIRDEGATQLSEALKSNSSLTALDLAGNRVLLQFVLTQYRQ
jgi:hypothetical protein